jgi:hypothetical protein
MTGTVRCANAKCRQPLTVDHVTLITTAHVRRFCSVECIAEGHRAHLDAIAAECGLVRVASLLDELDGGRRTA